MYLTIFLALATTISAADLCFFTTAQEECRLAPKTVTLCCTDIKPGACCANLSRPNYCGYLFADGIELRTAQVQFYKTGKGIGLFQDCTMRSSQLLRENGNCCRKAPAGLEQCSARWTVGVDIERRDAGDCVRPDILSYVAEGQEWEIKIPDEEDLVVDNVMKLVARQDWEEVQKRYRPRRVG